MSKIVDGKKTCPHCHETKPLSEFYQDRWAPNGHKSWCKKCDCGRTRGPRSPAARARRQDCKRQREYGVTPAEYSEMLRSQGGGCAICGMTPEEHGKRLYIDHDHETGRVRGLLCNKCNAGLGFLQDDPALLRQAAIYIEDV